MPTAEASISRFKGVSYDLPRNRNSEYAYRVRNVYEEQPGRLIRREGTRRAVEFQADGPVMMIVPLFEPSGHTTGRGADFLIQVDTEIRHVAASYASGVAPHGAPEVTSCTRINMVQGGLYDGYHRVVIKGRNFDQLPDAPISVTVGSSVAEYVEYLSAGMLIAYLNPYLSPADEVDVSVTVTNPDGESGTLAEGYSFA